MLLLRLASAWPRPEPHQTDMFRSWPRLSESLEPVHRGRLRSDGKARKRTPGSLRAIPRLRWRRTRCVHSNPCGARHARCRSGSGRTSAPRASRAVASARSRRHTPGRCRTHPCSSGQAPPTDDSRAPSGVHASPQPTSRLSLAWSPSTSSAEGPLPRIVQDRSSIAAAPGQMAKSRDRRLQVPIEPIPDLIHGRPSLYALKNGRTARTRDTTRRPSERPHLTYIVYTPPGLLNVGHIGTSRSWFRPGWSRCSTSSAASRMSGSRRQRSATLATTPDPSDRCSSGWEGPGRRGKRGPHAFKAHGFAAVRIGRDVRGPRGRLILTAIRRRALVGLNQFLVSPVVVGHARVARLHRLLRRGKRCTGGNDPGRQQSDCPHVHLRTQREIVTI